MSQEVQDTKMASPHGYQWDRQGGAGEPALASLKALLTVDTQRISIRVKGDE